MPRVIDDGLAGKIDATDTKYELASRVVIQLLKAASGGDETALKE